MTYMFISKCALKLVLKNILYYEARSEKHQISRQIFQKINKNQISLKSAQWGMSCSMRIFRRTDRETDMPRLMVLFPNVANASKNIDDSLFKE